MRVIVLKDKQYYIIKNASNYINTTDDEWLGVGFANVEVTHAD